MINQWVVDSDIEHQLNALQNNNRYQTKALCEMLQKAQAVYHLKEVTKKTNKLLLEAPTGAGKTVISGAFIESIFRQTENVIMIWLSETPQLVEQSMKKMNKMFQFETTSLDEAIIHKAFEPNQLYFDNWEKLKKGRKHVTSGEHKDSFQEMIRKAKSEGFFILYLVDEAHVNVDSDMSKELLEETMPHLMIEMTATPKKEKMKTAYFDTVHIDIEDVKEAGFIKQGIFFNEGIYEHELKKEYLQACELEDIEELLMYKSYEKRNELSRLSNEYTTLQNLVPVNPLLVIQIPNGNPMAIQKVKSFFERIQVSVEKGNMAIYTTEEKEGVASLEELNERQEIEVLVFKQSIAKGWDCPRASVLCTFREAKKRSFTIQTIGRIMRMPFLRKMPQDFDGLNYAYVYTENEDNKIYQEIQTEIEPLGFQFVEKVKKRPDVTLCLLEELPKFKWEPIGKSEQRSFLKGFMEDLKSFDWQFQFDEECMLSKKVPHGKVDSNLKQKEQCYWAVSIEEFCDNDIEKMFKQIMREQKMDEGFVKQYIFTKNKNTPLIENMKIFLQYQAYYIRVWNELKENNKRQTCQRNVLCETWSIPKELVLEKNYQVDKEEMSKKFVYDKLFYNQNFLEILMSNFLEEQEHVLFWLKNGDKGDKHFCIPYEVNGEKKLTYPDFLVETKEEIILIETKGILDGKETNEKWKAMKSYAERVAAIQNKKVRAILVKEKNGRLYVFTGRDVSDEYNLASKWEKLISLK